MSQVKIDALNVTYRVLNIYLHSLPVFQILVWLRKANVNVPLNQIITKNMKVCSCSQQTYVRTTRKAFACRVDGAVIRMKDSVFVWPSVNSRLIIPCRIIRTRLRSLNAASFPFFYCHGSTRRTVFPPLTHICSLVCEFVAGWSCFV